MTFVYQTGKESGKGDLKISLLGGEKLRNVFSVI